MKSFVICLFALLSFTMPALAEVGFQFTLPGLRAPDDPNVDGFRLSVLHGEADSVSGFDLGFFSFSETSKMSGFSAIFGVAKMTGSSSGLASGLVNIHTGEAGSINAAFINSMKSVKDGGANIGFLNLTDNYSPVDVGGLSVSDRSKVQVGFVNVTKKIEKLQIGFLNIADNGFFPVFPFFNYPKD